MLRWEPGSVISNPIKNLWQTDRPTNKQTDRPGHGEVKLPMTKWLIMAIPSNLWRQDVYIGNTENFWVFHSQNNINLYPIRKTQFWIRIPAISEWCLSPVKLQHRGDLGNPIFPTEIPFFRFYPPLPAFLMSSLVIKFSDRKNWSIT